MLDIPDLYKKIADLAREHIQQEMGNSSMPDFSQSDLLHAAKIDKRNYLVVIERLIKQCPINNDYEKHKKELQEYTQKYIEESFPLKKPETMFNLLNNFKTKEHLNLINVPLQAFVLYVELIRQLYFYIQEKYILKYVKKTKDKLTILTHLFIQYSLELLNGICSLLLGENYNSVISVYRIFYENYIVFNFLQAHTELTEAFFDHVTIDNCIMQMDFAKMNKTEIPNEISKAYDDLLSKYGEDFKDSYGWANSVIKDKNKRNLKTMFEKSNLGDSFKYFYKISCKYSHATAYSVMVRPVFNQLTGFLIEIADITDKEIKIILGKLTLKSTKEEALLYDWLGIATDNMRKEIFACYKEAVKS